MKRGTPDHPKVIELMDALDVSKIVAVGVLESLWHWAAKYALSGRVDQYRPSTIARSIGYEGDAVALIEGLRTAKWIDRVSAPGGGEMLVLHDWPDHADDMVHMTLARRNETFADGSLPSLTRFHQREKEKLEKVYARKRAETRGNARERAEMCTALAEAEAEAEDPDLKADTDVLEFKPKTKSAREGQNGVQVPADVPREGHADVPGKGHRRSTPESVSAILNFGRRGNGELLDQVMVVTREGPQYRAWWERVILDLDAAGELGVLAGAVEYAAKCRDPARTDLGELKSAARYLASKCKTALWRHGKRLPAAPNGTKPAN